MGLVTAIGDRHRFARHYVLAQANEQPAQLQELAVPPIPGFGHECSALVESGIVGVAANLQTAFCVLPSTVNRLLGLLGDLTKSPFMRNVTLTLHQLVPQSMQVVTPPEALPELDTVANPVALYDGEDAYVCYKASVGAGSANVILKFAGVIDFRVTPMNVDGLKDCRYPVAPWAFNEVIDGEETARWKALKPRFWLISFRDVAIEILFNAVSIVRQDHGDGPLHQTLISAFAD